MFKPIQHYQRLIAVSSARPNASPEIAANQARAKASWNLVFDKIIYVGPFVEALTGANTEFFDAENWPPISLMLLMAAGQEDPVCILNADIVVAQHLKQILNYGWQRHALAMTSERYEFDPATEDYLGAKIVDFGCDFFCAHPTVWLRAYKAIPGAFRCGHQRWDSWMLSWLWQQFPARFFNMSNHRPIFHPKHGDRNMPHHIAVAESDFPPSMGFPPRL